MIKMKERFENVISGEASKAEIHEFMEYVSTDEEMAVMNSVIQHDIDNADENFIKAWASDVPDELRSRFYTWLNGKQSDRNRWWLVAALVIPFILLSSITLFFANKSGVFAPTEYIEIVADKGKHIQVALSDGTVVELNSESKLRYPKHFALFHRDVQLIGEGYFTVAKDETSPFNLSVGDININVTGTKFNVDAYDDELFINVLLDEGAITLVTPKDNIEVKPSQYVSYNKKTKECTIKTVDENFSPAAWKQNILNFHMTPLRDILNIISRERDVNFTVKDTVLLDSRFTLCSKNEYTWQILHDIEQVSNVKFTLKEGVKNTYVVSKKE